MLNPSRNSPPHDAAAVTPAVGTPTNTTPTLTDIALLSGLQMGVSALAAGLLALLPFEIGSGSWVGIVGIISGSQAFVLIKEKYRPGTLDAAQFTSLSAYAMLVQLILAAIIFGGLIALGDESLRTASPALLIGITVFSCAIGFVATRHFLRSALRQSRTPRVQRRA